MNIFVWAVGIVVLLSSVVVLGATEIQNDTMKLSNEPQYLPHAPISIDSNADFNAEHGVIDGNGTEWNPWIIENLDINGTGYGYCIKVGNTTDNFIIRNCLIHKASGNKTWPHFRQEGIQLYKVSNARITNNVVEYNTAHEILLWLSSNNCIDSNLVHNTQYGIYIQSGCNNSIFNNNISYPIPHPPGVGVFVESWYNNVSDNVIINEGNGICSGGGANLYSGNRFYHNTHGLYNLISNDNTYQNNYFTGSSSAMEIQQSCRNNIENNTFYLNSGTALRLIGVHQSPGKECSYNKIYNNNIYNSWFGISLYGSTFNDLQGNILNEGYIWISSVTILILDDFLSNNIPESNFVDGLPVAFIKNQTQGGLPLNKGEIIIANCSNMVLENYTSVEEIIGLTIAFSTNLTIRNSTFTSSRGYGIRLYYTNYSTIYNNYFDNACGDLFCQEFRCCNIFHNSFLKGVQMSHCGGNIWDDGYPSGGNYWGDYIGVDENHGYYQNITGPDGIGDTKYFLDICTVDGWPLIQPLTPPQLSTATAIGPKGAGHETTITLRYNWSGNPLAIDLYYSLNHGDTWNYLGKDNTVDGYYNWTPEANPGPKPWKFYWIANVNNGSDDVGVPSNFTEPEAGPFNWKTFDILINNGQTLYNTNSPGIWQFVSIPLDVHGDIEAVLNDGFWGDGGTDWNCVMWYDAADVTDHWKSYRNDRPSELNDMLNLDNTMGFWIHITNNTGDGFLTVGEGVMPVSTTINLRAGWNLVGYPSFNETMTVANALWGTGADMVEVFSSVSPYIIEIGPTYIMKPGEGYWIHVPADTVWTVDW